MAMGIPAKHLYREAMEQVHSYNSKLLLDRRLRMPYIDNQTGLAQQDCRLWVSRVQRCAPLRKGQIYSYPSRRWMVRKRPDFIGSAKGVEKKPTAGETEDTHQETLQEEKITVDVKPEESVPILEPPVPTPAPVVFESAYEYYDDDCAFDSEFDSDEEFGSRKKKRKPARTSRSNKKGNMALKFGEKSGGGFGRIGGSSRDELYKPSTEEKKKHYDCQICNKRYKNQQSLRYHYEHYNHNLVGEAQTAAPAMTKLETSSQVDHPLPDHVSGAKRKKGMPPSMYCDFCLGTVVMNKKSGSPEELISCADCGRSGHPSCLQFNENLTGQVKKYKWQCIECKCCCLCGTSDNDEELLFCDDCDRGYHMYCLNPPISEPPEGSWQCQLCKARVNGYDLSKACVLPQHMDVVRNVMPAMSAGPPHLSASVVASSVHPPSYNSVPPSMPPSIPPSVPLSTRSPMHTSMPPTYPAMPPLVPPSARPSLPISLRPSVHPLAQPAASSMSSQSVPNVHAAAVQLSVSAPVPMSAHTSVPISIHASVPMSVHASGGPMSSIVLPTRIPSSVPPVGPVPSKPPPIETVEAIPASVPASVPTTVPVAAIQASLPIQVPLHVPLPSTVKTSMKM